MSKRFQENGDAPAPRRRLQGQGATINDIARLSGVSVATVSRVMNDHPSVADETRENVLRVARDHNFKSSISARSLAGGKTGLIGVAIPGFDTDYHYPGAIVAGISDELERHNLELLLSVTHYQHERELTVLQRFRRARVDGLLLVLPSESGKEIAELHHRHGSVVVIDPHHPIDHDVPAVVATNTAGARELVDHLLSLGHRRIGAVMGSLGWLATTERLAGYHAALALAGIAPDPELLVAADFRELDSGRVAMERLLALPDPPTAVFAFSDFLAVGALHACQDRGVAVPGDISLVGFDDALVAAQVRPALTTVQQPLFDLGRMGASLLVRIMEGQRIDATRLDLATRLVIRDSTAPPRPR